MYFKKYIEQYVCIVFKLLVSINFFILNFFKIKFTHNTSMGFGDGFLYLFLNYRKIKKNKLFVFNFSDTTASTSEFFFGKKKTLITFPKLPIRIHYIFMNYLRSINYRFSYSTLLPYDQKKIIESNNLRYSFARLIKCKIKKKNRCLLNNYICIHIKHYNNNLNDISGSSLRQVCDFKKIEKLFLHLLHKKTNIVILNSRFDGKSYQNLKIIKSKINKDNKIFFANQLFPKFTFEDQCNLAINSSGYIGTDGGPLTLYILLGKKSVVFDTFKRGADQEKIAIRYQQNFKYTLLYKTITFQSKNFILSEDIINLVNKDRIDFQINDTKYHDIENEVNNIFF